MKNDYISKWKLFITSYIPLYIWLLFSNIDYSDFSKLYSSFTMATFSIVLLFLILISVIEICSLFKGSGSEKEPLPKNMVISPESDSLMNYVVTYFTPLISFDIHDARTVAMNIFLFLLIGLMYVGSSATYLNPVLGAFGFKIFGVTGFPKAHHIISRLSFDELETSKDRHDKVIRYRLGDGIYIIKPYNRTYDDE